MVGNHTLDEICLKITDGTHSTVKDDSDGNCFLLSAKNIKNGHVCYNTDTDRKISKETLLFLRNRTRTEIGDVLITTVGTIGEISSVDDDNYEFQRSVALLKPNPSIITSKFLEYSLKTAESQLMLENFVSGSVQKCIFLDSIKQLKISVPGLKIQNKIINILSSIDSLITLNSRINDYLLKLGEAIFDYYQEDADVSCTINDLAEEIVCGKTPSTSYKEYYGEDIPFITIPDLHNSPVIVRTERYLSNIGAETQKKKTLPAHSICVSCIATPGLVSLTSELSQTNQQINSIICKKSIPPLYVYYLMRSSSDVIINLGSSGSATLNLNKTQFSQIKINILAPIEMLNFNNETKYILQLIELNSKTNVILESLRDMLLPLLMSGEIDVSKLDLGS